MFGWNLSWEQAWKITEQVVIVCSQSEAPEIHIPLASGRPGSSTAGELVFLKWFSPWLRVLHLSALTEWVEVIYETWVECSKGTSWMGARCKIGLMKCRDPVCVASQQIKVTATWLFYLNSGMMWCLNSRHMVSRALEQGGTTSTILTLHLRKPESPRGVKVTSVVFLVHLCCSKSAAGGSSRFLFPPPSLLDSSVRWVRVRVVTPVPGTKRPWNGSSKGGAAFALPSPGGFSLPLEAGGNEGSSHPCFPFSSPQHLVDTALQPNRDQTWLSVSVPFCVGETREILCVCCFLGRVCGCVEGDGPCDPTSPQPGQHLKFKVWCWEKGGIAGLSESLVLDHPELPGPAHDGALHTPTEFSRVPHGGQSVMPGQTHCSLSFFLTAAQPAIKCCLALPFVHLFLSVTLSKGVTA